ncbi:major facilitator superfamily domain-containing protein [Dipodascopsis tothii]|uniref:major facilitator superfamily domain-containing protein n=1 Tax=Dipodascopsis tothii TaxID=44089 RepID=UPI0034CE4278
MAQTKAGPTVTVAAVEDEPGRTTEAVRDAALLDDMSYGAATMSPYSDDPATGQAELADAPAPQGFWRTPSIYVLLVFFILFTIAFGGTIAPKINLSLALICREHFAEDGLVGSLGDIDSQCHIPEIHAAASRLNMWIGIITGLCAALVAPHIGSLADRYGRTRMMALAAFGPFIGDSIWIYAGQSANVHNYWLLLVAAACDGATGSFLTVVAVSNSYSSDCTPHEKRARVFALFHGLLFVGNSVGPTLASYMVDRFDNLLAFFYLAVAMQGCFILGALLVIPESLTKASQLHARELHRLKHQFAGQQSALRRVAGALNVFAPLRVLWPKEGFHLDLKRNILALSVMDALVIGNGMGEFAAGLMYAEYAFDWGSVETGYYMTWIGIIRVVNLFVVLPAAIQFIRRKVVDYRRWKGTYVPFDELVGANPSDVVLVRTSLTFNLMAYVGFAAAKTQPQFVVAGTLSALGSGSSPLLQATASKHVQKEQIGALLGAFALLHAMARVVGPTVFLLIYSATVGWFTNALFFVFLLIYSAVFLGTFLVTTDHRDDLLQESDDDSTALST